MRNKPFSCPVGYWRFMRNLVQSMAHIAVHVLGESTRCKCDVLLSLLVTRGQVSSLAHRRKPAGANCYMTLYYSPAAAFTDRQPTLPTLYR